MLLRHCLDDPVLEYLRLDAVPAIAWRIPSLTLAHILHTFFPAAPQAPLQELHNIAFC